MTQDFQTLIGGVDVLGLGEPVHGSAAFGRARNEAFALLAGLGFRSFALETDRVAAFTVDDYVRKGEGDLDAVMTEGFTHGFGAFAANRELVAWMRAYNEERPAAERLAFHGVDAPLEFTAASPRADLEHVRDYLGLDHDIAALAGDDERWSREEAVRDPAASSGDAPEARELRVIADDMRSALYAAAPERIAATSPEAWHRARTRLSSALGLLRYHRQAARRLDESERWSRLSGVRDALMAENLLDIRAAEAPRGPTLLSGHNIHLQLPESRMGMAGMDLRWNGVGAVARALLGNRYAFVAGSEAPEGRTGVWGLRASEPGEAALEGAAAVLHAEGS
ncbi:erythromycin esterase family protein [Glycomyces paridis]|uniref:Erythromycin esterase family protein n=1 Tax=Glycomyces paridis TaxID=2126555 RepID=A0A4S8PTH7_9ACTN|nr:erythromycin esterase family protein [Glycomyces paridis]THV31374.1 erythromycin esterase family protein [Glycomyces paridis]